MRKSNGTYKVDLWINKGVVEDARKSIQEVRMEMESCPGKGWEQVTAETATDPNHIGLWHQKPKVQFAGMDSVASDFPGLDEELM